MIQNATGLILRTRPLTETSLIVNWLTPEFGRISTVAKGARRPKSPFAGKLDLFYLADFTFTRSPRSELHTLRELAVRDTHPALRQDLARLQQASYAAALVQQATETETPLPEVFALTRGFLAVLNGDTSPQPRNVFAFELKLLAELGLSPDLDNVRLPPATRELIGGLQRGDWAEIARLQATAAQARELRQFLHGFLIFHLGKVPKGRPVS